MTDLGHSWSGKVVSARLRHGYRVGQPTHLKLMIWRILSLRTGCWGTLASFHRQRLLPVTQIDFLVIRRYCFEVLGPWLILTAYWSCSIGGFCKKHGSFLVCQCFPRAVMNSWLAKLRNILNLLVLWKFQILQLFRTCFLNLSFYQRFQSKKILFSACSYWNQLVTHTIWNLNLVQLGHWMQFESSTFQQRFLIDE